MNTLREREIIQTLQALAIKEASADPENSRIRYAIDWLNDKMSEERQNHEKRLKSSEMTQEVRSDLLQLKALQAILEAQNSMMPSCAFGKDAQLNLHQVTHQLCAEIDALEQTGERTGLDRLQREAIAKYGDYGLLIEELRDSANGKLPDCFTAIGNLLARYRDFSTEDRTLENWIWTLENMKSALQSEIDKQNQELYARRGV